MCKCNTKQGMKIPPKKVKTNIVILRGKCLFIPDYTKNYKKQCMNVVMRSISVHGRKSHIPNSS